VLWRGAVAGLVLAAHALLLWSWPVGTPAPRGGPAPVVTLVAIAPPPASARTDVPPASARTDVPPPPVVGALPATRTAPRRNGTPARPAPEAAPVAAAADVEATALPEAAPAAAASAALDMQLPRGAGAERGALMQPDRSMVRQALNDPRSNVRHDPTQDLSLAVAAAGEPDCLKDPKAAAAKIGPIGVGGLLGLPVLVARIATGRCAK
jgi:hypothetical protein